MKKTEEDIAKYIKRRGLHSGLDYSEEITYEECLEIARGILKIIGK